MSNSLPALSIILDVRLVAGEAFVDQRVDVRPIAADDAASAVADEAGGAGAGGQHLVHLVLRYGFAEQPDAADNTVVGALLAVAAADPRLAALEHARCTLGHCLCAAPATPCQLVTVFTAQDHLEASTWAQALPAYLYNSLAVREGGAHERGGGESGGWIPSSFLSHPPDSRVPVPLPRQVNSNGRASALGLPLTQVVEVASFVDLGRLDKLDAKLVASAAAART